MTDEIRWSIEAIDNIAGRAVIWIMLGTLAYGHLIQSFLNGAPVRWYEVAAVVILSVLIAVEACLRMQAASKLRERLQAVNNHIGVLREKLHRARNAASA